MFSPPQPRSGFVNVAEAWNGCLAMLGFTIKLATELLTGTGILSQMGIGRDQTLRKDHRFTAMARNSRTQARRQHPLA